MRRVKIVGTGIYIPERRVSSRELAELIGVEEDLLIHKVGVKSRYYAGKQETASFMAAQAARAALKEAHIDLNAIDLIVSASGSMQMPIPYNAALIHRELQLPDGSGAAFDINSTCLSFVTALDVVSYLIEAGKYKNVLIVSSEIASVGLNYRDLETASLFSDGAAAVVVTRSAEQEQSRIIGSEMSTFSSGWNYCTIPGGGSACPPQNWSPETKELYQFQMDGKEIFRLASQTLPSFVEGLLSKNGTDMSNIDLVIPHQASLPAINILQKKLKIEPHKCVNIVEDYGNMIAASIPTALHLAISRKQLRRGERVLLIGTSAGLSIGGLIFDF